MLTSEFRPVKCLQYGALCVQIRRSFRGTIGSPVRRRRCPMRARVRPGIFAALCVMAFPATLALGAAGFPQSAPGARSLTLEQRVAARRAIEQVYWDHRIWPADNKSSKPSLDAVMPDTAIRAKVEETARQSNALEKLWGQPVTPQMLQAEIDRIVRGSRQIS